MKMLPLWVLPPTLPSVYDSESFTSLEMTAKVYGAMRELIKEYNEFATSLNANINKFMEETDEYLRTELPETAEKIIADGFADGTLPIPTDKNLTKEGAPADAKATGAKILAEVNALTAQIKTERARIDQLSKLPEGSTTGDAEIADARIGANLKPYANLGEAIRTQVESLMTGIAIKTGAVKTRSLGAFAIPDGFDMMQAAIRTGSGAYYDNGSQIAYGDPAADAVNGTNYGAFRFAVIPVEPGKDYACNYPTRFVVPANDADQVVGAQQTETRLFNAGAASVVYVTYNSKFTDFGIYKGSSVPAIPAHYELGETISAEWENLRLKNVPIHALSGVSVKAGTNIMPTAIAKKPGSYARSASEINYYSPVYDEEYGTSYGGYYCAALPVKKNTAYTFSEAARFVNFATSAGAPVGNQLENVKQITTGDAVVMFITYPADLEGRYAVAEGTKVPTMETEYEVPGLHAEGGSGVTAGDLAQMLYGSGSITAKSASLTAGGRLELPGSAIQLKKNNTIAFTANMPSSAEIIIGKGKNSYGGSYLMVNAAEYWVAKYTDIAEYVYNQGHMNNHIDKISIVISVKNGTADIMIQDQYTVTKITDVAWDGSAAAPVFVECSSGTLTDCTLTWSSDEFRRSIWLLGDSYCGITDPARWAYYLKENGQLDNVNIIARAGANSAELYNGFLNALKLGVPKYAIWALGMNDGTDYNTSNFTNWKSYLQKFLDTCEAYGITPILATIPSVPTIFHMTKNATIRDSGHRYIEFAYAVGAGEAENATSNLDPVEWLPFHLSADNVHPTDKGAVRLYMQAITDCPELTFR